MGQLLIPAGRLLLIFQLFTFSPIVAAASFSDSLFGYQQQPQQSLNDFPQWVNALERHIQQRLPDGDCQASTLNRCHLQQWTTFLQTLRALPLNEQLRQVNKYANSRPYVLDIDNYNLPDYWAIPRELFANGGDCEDYAITKMLSLRWLQYPPELMRIVVLQDTNLRVAHAVLAVATDSDVLILDNQARNIISHRNIVHYVPVYSINESRWWLHLPTRPS